MGRGKTVAGLSCLGCSGYSKNTNRWHCKRGLSGKESPKKWHILAWSAYHLCVDLRSMRADNLESSSVAEHQGWLELWDTNVPGKAKIHTWRLIRNGLAVGAKLQR